MKIQKGSWYLKKEEPKTAENIQTDQMYMAFGPLTSSFSVERDFNISSPCEIQILFCRPEEECHILYYLRYTSLLGQF